MTDLHGYDGASLNNETIVRACKAAGGIWVSLYVSGRPGGQDPAPDGFAQVVQGIGLGSNPNYEIAIDELRSDVAHGLVAGRVGIGDTIRVGYQADGTIAIRFSVDEQVAPSDFHLVGDAFQGINEVNAGRFLIADYGEGALASYLRQQRQVVQAKAWLSESSSFAGFDVHNPDVCLVQNHDSAGNWLNSNVPGTDINTITDVAGLMALWPPNSPYGGTDMTPEEHAALMRIDAAVSIDQTHPAVVSLGSLFHAVMSEQTDTTHPNTLASVKLELDAIQKAQGNGPVDVSALATALAPLVAPSLAQPLAQAMVAHVQLTAK